MKYLGFAGIEGAGKDTAAGYALEWAERYGLKAKRQGFADLLKLSAARALGFPVEGSVEAAVEFCNALKLRGNITVDIPRTREEADAGLSDDESITFSGRDYLRWYGTEAHREVFDTDFWVDALMDSQAATMEPGGTITPAADLLVVPDTRFDNEARAIIANGGQVVEVHRPGVMATGSHVSEAGLSDELVSCSIRNDTDLEALRKATFDTLDALILG